MALPIDINNGLMFKGPSQGYAVDQAIDYKRYQQQMLNAQQGLQGLGNVFGAGIVMSTMMAGMANAQNAYVAQPDYVKLIDEEFRMTGWGRKEKKSVHIDLRWPNWSEIVELWRGR